MRKYIIKVKLNVTLSVQREIIISETCLEMPRSRFLTRAIKYMVSQIKANLDVLTHVSVDFKIANKKPGYLKAFPAFLKKIKLQLLFC